MQQNKEDCYHFHAKTLDIFYAKNNQSIFRLIFDVFGIENCNCEL